MMDLQTGADLLDTFVADTYLDGDVDSADLVLLVNSFGSSIGDVAKGDLNKPGTTMASSRRRTLAS